MANTIILERTLTAQGLSAGQPVRKRVYIFLTRQGFVFICLLLVMLLGAVNYNNGMAYILTFLLSSLFMICMLHSYRNLRDLIITSCPAMPVFAGESVRLPLLLDNRSGSARISLEIFSAPEKSSPYKSGKNNLVTLNLKANELTKEYLTIATTKRGYVKAERLCITSTYPLGLFRAWSYMEPDILCTVYPAPAGSRTLPVSVAHDAYQHSGSKTGTDDFTGFQAYRPGDSIRSIDWKAVARERGLLVKRFSGSGTTRLILHWDQAGRTMDTEQRLSQLCLWILEAARQDIVYGLEIPGNFIDLNSGDIHKHQCLEALAGYGFGNA